MLVESKKLKDGEIKIIQSNLYKIAKEKKLKNDFFKKLEIEQGNIKEFIGRVKEFFETNQPTENIESLNEKQKLLEQELKTFKSKIAQFDSILAHKLDEFNEQITLFASEIGLSHQGRYLFSLDNIDITVRDENHPRPISMKSIGGLNILGFHLITLLGLHQYFISEKSPVPSFLILDQPIQGYSSDNKNDDTDKINKMIQLVLKVCKDSGLQVILTEHEQLSQEELHRVEEKHWTTDYALIPKKWIQ